jgi:hypothetical protein
MLDSTAMLSSVLLSRLSLIKSLIVFAVVVVVSHLHLWTPRCAIQAECPILTRKASRRKSAVIPHTINL